MKTNVKKLILFTLLVTISTTGNTEPTSDSKVLLVEPELFDTRIDLISILPVIDVRDAKSTESTIGFDPNFAGAIRSKMSGEIITIKHYKVNNPDSYGMHKTVSYTDLENPSKEWINKLGPENSTHVLVLVFFNAHAEAHVMLDKEGSAELSAYLFDKKKGKLVWKNKYRSHDQSFGFGLGFGLMGLSRSDYMTILKSFSTAVAGLMQDFPDKGMSLEEFNKLQAIRLAERVQMEEETNEQ